MYMQDAALGTASCRKNQTPSTAHPCCVSVVQCIPNWFVAPGGGAAGSRAFSELNLQVSPHFPMIFLFISLIPSLSHPGPGFEHVRGDWNFFSGIVAAQVYPVSVGL